MMALPKSIKSEILFLVTALPYLVHLVLVLDLSSPLPLNFTFVDFSPDNIIVCVTFIM